MVEMIGLYGSGVETPDVFDARLSALKNYGYREKADPKKFGEKAILAKLKKLSKIPSETEEELIFLWDPRDEEHQKMYLAAPVMIALLLKEYELAEKLVDQGYEANDYFLPEQYYLETRKYGSSLYTPLLFSQALMAMTDMPSSLYQKICDQQLAGSFSFHTDYWHNPFLITDKDVAQKKKMKSMEGFRALRERAPELLQDILSDTMTRGYSGWEDCEPVEWQKMIRELIGYFYGMPEEIHALNQYLIECMQSQDERMDMTKGEKLHVFWVQILPELLEACGSDQYYQSMILSSMIGRCYCLSRCNFIKLKQTICSKLTDYIKKQFIALCPEWYTAEDFLNWMAGHTSCYTSSELLKLWESFTGKTIRFDKQDPNLWEILFRLVDGSDFDTDLKIPEAIRLLERIDSSEWSDVSASEEERRLQASLFSGIISWENEEILLACIQKKLITKDVIPALIKCSLVFRKKKLLPVLMLHKEECK